MGLLGEKSVRKGHFGENWAVKVKTGLIQKMSVPKLLEVKIWSFWQNWAFRENECAKRTTGGKNWAFVESQYAEGTLRKFGHFGENGAFGKNECEKRTLW